MSPPTEKPAPFATGPAPQVVSQPISDTQVTRAVLTKAERADLSPEREILTAIAAGGAK
ncbi:MAG: hypothetical protein ACR2ME_09905 [Acidimicrobiia bacterium]